MTCNQLGGACNKEFQAETFEEIAEMSKQHGMEMFQSNDEAHLEAAIAEGIEVAHKVVKVVRNPSQTVRLMESALTVTATDIRVESVHPPGVGEVDLEVVEECVVDTAVLPKPLSTMMVRLSQHKRLAPKTSTQHTS